MQQCSHSLTEQGFFSHFRVTKTGFMPVLSWIHPNLFVLKSNKGLTLVSSLIKGFLEIL